MMKGSDVIRSFVSVVGGMTNAERKSLAAILEDARLSDEQVKRNTRELIERVVRRQMARKSFGTMIDEILQAGKS